MEHHQGSDSEQPCSCATDKALEYYVKYGKNRNIEKFLRLQPERIHSHRQCHLKMSKDDKPHCSKKMSHCSTVLTSQILPLEISDPSSDEADEHLEQEQVKTKTEEPVEEKCQSIEVDEKEEVKVEQPVKETKSSKQTEKTSKTKNKSVDFKRSKTVSGSSSTDTNASATLVRIFKESVEAELRKKHRRETKSKSDRNEETVSDDDFRTPPGHKSSDRRHTHTPESMSRSHRRLEWDSLADIGYRRSMSHSNISVLERMVLKQLLQDCSVNNLTERDYKLLEVLLQEKDTNQITRTKSLDTPPLASSTHVELKEHIQPTPIPMEKSVQTTMSRASKTTQEVQVNLLSEKSNVEKLSVVETEIHSFVKSANTDSELSAEHKEEQNAYVCDTLLESTSTEGFQVSFKSKSFHRSKSLDTPTTEPTVAEKAVQSSEETNYKRFEQVIMSGISSLNNTSEEEAKIALDKLEKTLHEQLLKRKKSTSKNAQTKQLELGVQLLCALIEARQIKKNEKQQLVTDIVKRICRICGNNAASELLIMMNSSTRTTNSSTSSDGRITQRGMNFKQTKCVYF